MAIRQSPLHAAHSYEITPAALRIRSSKGGSIFAGPPSNLKRMADRLFTFINHRNAYIVPRRAFDSDEQLMPSRPIDAFATAALQRWEQSQRL